MARSSRTQRVVAVAAGVLLCALTSAGVVALVDHVHAARGDELAAEAGAAAARGELERALVYWQDAADLGNADAQHNLGHAHLDGVVVAQDDRLAVFWIRRAAEQGHAEAQEALGRLCGEGRGGPRDPTEGFRWTRRAAQQGVAEAQVRLGALYEEGRGIEASGHLAQRWYASAAEQDHTEGQYALGLLFARGVGVPRSPSDAQYWLETAAHKGHIPAQVALGDLIFEEDPNSGSAFDWFREAADSGDPGAQYRAARGRDLGYGARQDSSLATKWYLASAGQGTRESQLELAKHYQEGNGIRRNLAQAMHWYAKAEEQGSGAAASARRALARQAGGEESPHDPRWKRELAAHPVTTGAEARLAAHPVTTGAEARLAAKRRERKASKPWAEPVGRCAVDGVVEMRSKLDCLSRGGDFTATGGDDHVGVTMGDQHRYWEKRKSTLRRQLRRAHSAAAARSGPAAPSRDRIGHGTEYADRDADPIPARASWFVCHSAASLEPLIGSAEWASGTAEGQLMCGRPAKQGDDGAETRCSTQQYPSRQTFETRSQATEWVRRRCSSVD